MDVVKDICEKLGVKPKFVNAGARGYQVRLGIPRSVTSIPIAQRDQFKQAMNTAISNLQQKIIDAGYPRIKASAVGATKEILAFVVPYETKMFEGKPSPDFAKAAKLMTTYLARGKHPAAISQVIKDRFGFSDNMVANVLQYVTLNSVPRTPMREGTMPGPTDQGGASTPPPHTGPSNSISAPAPDVDTESKPSDSNDNSQQDSVDPKQTVQQNPDLADFFAAMAKLKPEEIQNMTQMFTGESGK